MTVLYTLLIINYFFSIFFTILIEYGLKLPDEKIVSDTKGKITFEQIRDIRENWDKGKWLMVIPFVTLFVILSLFLKMIYKII